MNQAPKPWDRDIGTWAIGRSSCIVTSAFWSGHNQAASKPPSKEAHNRHLTELLVCFGANIPQNSLN